jgi:hypothetical protein
MNLTSQTIQSKSQVLSWIRDYKSNDYSGSYQGKKYGPDLTASRGRVAESNIQKRGGRRSTTTVLTPSFPSLHPTVPLFLTFFCICCLYLFYNLN